MRGDNSVKSYVLLYKGGETPKDEKAGQKMMKAWTDWFTKLGAAVVDSGNPFGPAVTIAKSGSKEGAGRNPVNGYSILKAESLKTAVKLAKGCPILKSENGEIQVHEITPM
jgi:hypothetical protein